MKVQSLIVLTNKDDAFGHDTHVADKKIDIQLEDLNSITEHIATVKHTWRDAAGTLWEDTEWEAKFVFVPVTTEASFSNPINLDGEFKINTSRRSNNRNANNPPSNIEPTKGALTRAEFEKMAYPKVVLKTPAKTTTTSTTTSTTKKSKDGLFDLNGTYYITDAKHKEALRAAPGGGLVHNGIPPNSPANAFNWYFMPTGDGYYYIYNLQFNKALVSADYGGGLSQKDPNGKATAQWKITPSGTAGQYIITDRKHGKSLVAGDENNNFVYHQPHDNRQNAYWTFTATDAKAPATKPNPTVITETPPTTVATSNTPNPSWFINNKSWVENDFVQIKNKANNHYIFNQDGQPKDGLIKDNGLDAQWEFVPYAGRKDVGNFRHRSNPNLYLIFNRTGKLEIMENANPQWSSALWNLKPSSEQGWVYIKSSDTGGDIFIKNGQLIVGGIEGAEGNGLWKIEGASAVSVPVNETTTASTSSKDFVQIQNYWKKNHFIHNQNSKLESGSIQTDGLGSQWKIIPTHSGWVRIQNQMNPDHYLHNQNGKIEVGTIDPNWASAMWKLIPTNTKGWVRIQNSWNKDFYLHNQNGKIEVGKIDPSWGSALWKVANEKNRSQESITSVSAEEALPAAASGFVRIQNNWKKSHYVHNQDGLLKADQILPNWSSSEWKIVKYPQGDLVYIQSKSNPDHYLNNQFDGKLKVGTINRNYPGALWKLVPAQDGWVRIESTTSNQFLHNQNGKIEVGTIDPNWASALWKVE